MATIQELISNLKFILKLLYEEKEALLHNDGNKVAEILENKKIYIENLTQLKGLDIEHNQKVMSLIHEINSLQEINLLLTKQALSYQEMLIESIAKNIQNRTTTYSQKGSFNITDNINFIDQSV